MEVRVWCEITKRKKMLIIMSRSFQVAKTLFNDECLRHCPRCQHPAKCQVVKGEGVCTRADCAFQFCTACLCAFHGSKECGSGSVGRRKKDSLLPGSAQSKRNIRRLWQGNNVNPSPLLWSSFINVFWPLISEGLTGLSKVLSCSEYMSNFCANVIHFFQANVFLIANLVNS